MENRLYKNEIYALLQEKQISYTAREHEAVFTMEEMERAGISSHGIICKNLFLRDAKGKNHFLLSVPEETKINLRTVHEQLGCTKVSFASAERLEKYLGLRQGSVSPLGALNDETRTVTVVFDASLCNQTEIGVHPNDNTATVWLSFADLKSLLEAHGTLVRVMDFSEQAE